MERGQAFLVEERVELDQERAMARVSAPASEQVLGCRAPSERAAEFPAPVSACEQTLAAAILVCRQLSSESDFQCWR